MCDGPDLFLCALSILFPPIGVWIKRGICSADSLINIALSCLGYLPGLIHSWYIICSYPDSYERIPGNDNESHVQVFYYRPGANGSSSGPPPSAGPPPGGHSSPAAPSGGYGTISSQPAPQQQMPQPAASSSAAAGPSSGEPSYAAVAAKIAGADLPSGTERGLASEEDGPPPPTYADAVRGNNKIQSHE